MEFEDRRRLIRRRLVGVRLILADTIWRPDEPTALNSSKAQLKPAGKQIQAVDLSFGIGFLIRTRLPLGAKH
jgi:hypothetical protein